MSVSLRVTGTWAELTADGAVAIPATPQAGDRMYLFARWKDFSVTATVANWTELVEFADGAVSAGNGTGSVKVACWYRDWQSGDTDPTIDFSASPDNASVVIMVMTKSADDVWLTPVARTAAMTTWTTTSQSVSASATVEVPSSGVVMGLIGIRDDTATMTRPTNGIDDSGGLVTWNGNYVESPATHHSTTTGFDGAADLGYRLVTTGAADATLRLTGTISAAETGAALWVVQGVSVLVTPSVASLTISTFAPLLKLAITPAVAVLALTTFAPSLIETVTPASSTLAITTFAAQLDQRITPLAATLAVTTFTPRLQEALTPASAVLSVSGFAPSLNTAIVPETALLLLSNFAPDVIQNILITIPTASLTITTSRPHVLPFQLVYLDPGGDATQAVGHFNTDVGNTGLVTFDSSQQVVGVGSYKFDSDNGSQPVCASVNGIMDVNRRVGMYFVYDSVPDAVETTTKFPTAFEAYSGAGVPNPNGFADAENCTADDAVYSTATPVKNAGQGTVYGLFGFAVGNPSDEIPIGASIDSVKIIYGRKYDVDDSIGISRVKYRIDGEEGPDHDNTDMPLTDTVVEVDVTGDREWTPAVLTNAMFEVIAEARRGDTDTEHTQSWDYLKVVIEWHVDTIISVLNSIDADGFRIGAAPQGDGVVLRLLDRFGVFYYGITELLPNVQNRISFAYVQVGSMAEVNLFVNDILELSIVDMEVGGSPMANLRYGWVDSPGVDHLCWFDQLAIDAGDDLQDIGNLLMTAKLSASVNEDNWSTTVGTGAVNERPLSEPNHMRHNPSTAERQSYTLQAASVGDVDISGEPLVGYMGWVWTKSSNNSTLEEISLIVNGVTTDRTLDFFSGPNNAPFLLRSAVTDTAYPSDAAGVGMTGNIDTADMFLFECGAAVAYEGPPNPDILLERQEVANETLDTIVDDLRADPPDSYEVCCSFPEFDGTVEIVIHSLTRDGGEFQYQGTLSGNGRLRITPGIEVRLDVTAVGATMLTIWRRINVD